MAHWLHTDLRHEVEATLLEPASGGAILHAPAMSAIWRRYRAGATAWHRPSGRFVLKWRPCAQQVC